VPVAIHPRWYKYAVRALLPCLEHRHGGTNPESAGLITGGGYHPAGGRSADDNALTLQPGVVQLFDRGVEGIHVEVQNHLGVAFCRRNDMVNKIVKNKLNIGKNVNEDDRSN
jgi:hypothetical protein